MSAKILLVDDSQLIRALMRSAIEKSSDWIVCGEAENGKIAVEMVEKLQPALVILDLSMPGMNGLETAGAITLKSPEMPMIMFTLHASPSLVKEAQRVGIKHVFSKSDGFGETVLEAIRAMLSGNERATTSATQTP
jgi:two-component system, NarL family, response regulator YdfI